MLHPGLSLWRADGGREGLFLTHFSSLFQEKQAWPSDPRAEYIPNFHHLSRQLARLLLPSLGPCSLCQARSFFSGSSQICPVVVQLLSCIRLFATPWTAAPQDSLSITNSQSLLKLMSIVSVMPPNHLILCHPLLLLPSIFPSVRVFSDESALHIRWPKYWSFRFCEQQLLEAALRNSEQVMEAESGYKKQGTEMNLLTNQKETHRLRK